MIIIIIIIIIIKIIIIIIKIILIIIIIAVRESPIPRDGHLNVYFTSKTHHELNQTSIILSSLLSHVNFILLMKLTCELTS